MKPGHTPNWEEQKITVGQPRHRDVNNLEERTKSIAILLMCMLHVLLWGGLHKFSILKRQVQT